MIYSIELRVIKSQTAFGFDQYILSSWTTCGAKKKIAEILDQYDEHESVEYSYVIINSITNNHIIVNSQSTE